MSHDLSWSQTIPGTRWLKWSSATLYLISIALGNLFVILFGIGTLQLVSVTEPDKVFFAVTFPLGALWVGLTFSFRDFVQRYWSHQKCWIWMGIAGMITFLYNKEVAIASLVSFMVSEGLDWLVFYFLRHKTLKVRMVVSNLVSCPVDSILFVTLAFGLPWYSEVVWGQAIVKYVCGLFALPLIPLVEWFFNNGKRKFENGRTK